MKKSHISLIILSGLCIVFSCSRENEMPGGMQERSISFSASAASEAESTLTKTSYGSVSAGNQTIEWTDGDRISLYSPHAVLYSPGGTPAVPATSYRLSVGGSTTVVPVSPEFPLMWGLTNPHVFVAKYPDPTWDTGANTPYAYEPFRSQSAASTDFLCYLPNTQPAILSSGTTYLPEMKYCYMAAYRAAAPNTSVNLTFTPCVSAFEIIIPNSYNNAVETFTVKKVELISATKRLSGAYTVHLTDLSYVENNPRTLTVPAPVTEADRSVAVDFGAGVAVTSSNSLHFTVFTCPVDLDDLTIRVTLASDDQQTLELRESNSGDWLEFDAFKKYLITCGNVPDPYEFDVTTDVTSVTTTGAGSSTGGTATIHVTSTKSKIGIDSGSPWKAQYSTNGVDGWTDITTPTAGITLSQYSGSGDPAGEDVTVTLAAGTSGSVTGVISYQFLDPPADNSEKANAIDLSRYNFMDNTMESTYETANCYVIRAPGWYKFPLVYGNAVKGASVNTVNTTSFTCGVANVDKDSYYSYMGTGDGEINFVDGKGTAITSSQITGATTVGISWQDAANEVITRSGDNAYCIDGDYVYFYVPADKIQPCNVVLKVMDSSSNTIWSWHIWMVPSNSDPVIAADPSLQFGVKGVTNNSSVTHDMLTVNLGQLPPVSGSQMGYAGGTYYIRFVSSVPGVTQYSPVVTVTRPPVSGSGAWSNLKGKYTRPLYQWGRKEPMLTFNGDDTNERSKVDWGAEISSDLHKKYRGDDTFSTANATSDLSSVVANPATFYTRTGGGIGEGCWYTSGVASKGLANLWDTAQKGALNNASPVKSVYDPSPRGFRVAGKEDFTGFTTDNVIGSWNNGWYFKCNSSDMQGIFFHAKCYRGIIGEIYTTAAGYYWSSSSTNPTNGSHLYFTNTSCSPVENRYKANGYSIRPVRE